MTTRSGKKVHLSNLYLMLKIPFIIVSLNILSEYEKVRKIILLNQDIDPDYTSLDIYEYPKYALRSGAIDEKKGEN